MGKRRSSKKRRSRGDPPGLEEEEGQYDSFPPYNDQNLEKQPGYATPTPMPGPTPEKVQLDGLIETEELIEVAGIKETNVGKDNEEEDNEEEEPEYEMEEDVYTILFLYGFSFISVYSLAIISLQVVIVCLFYIDLFQDNTEINRLNVPIAVDKQVVIAQLLALPLAVMSHEDCTTAIYQLSAQYDPAVREQFPNATRLNWNLTLFLRFMIGFLLVFISFIQIVQSTTITDLFLNLEAIVFVGNIDNFGFWLAEKNFIKQEFKTSCERVKDVSFKASRGQRQTIFRRIGALVTLGILVAGWFTVLGKQKAGLFLQDKACNSFDVTFLDYTLDVKTSGIDIDDPNALRSYSEFFIKGQPEDHEVELLYSAFSGTYKIGLNLDGSLEIREQRAVYYEFIPGFNQTYRDKSLGKFFYCDGAWIFTIEAFQGAFDREDDQEELACGRWLLRSQPTDAFFLEEVSPDNWRVWTGSVDTAEDLSLICNDCEKSVDCNYRGTCVNNACECDPSGFGPTCGLDPPCLNLQVVDAGETSSDYTESILPPFQLLKKDGTPASSYADDLLLVYGRPVYSAEIEEGVLVLLYYLGSRWNIAAWPDDIFSEFFLGDIPAHTFWDQLFQISGFASSEPTKVGMPVGIRWEYALSSKSRGNFGPFLAREDGVGLGFNCITDKCSGKSLCGDYGECIDGRCACDGCFGGYFCEYGPNEDYAIDDFRKFVMNETYSNEYVETYFLGRDCTDAITELQDEGRRRKLRVRNEKNKHLEIYNTVNGTPVRV